MLLLGRGAGWLLGGRKAGLGVDVEAEAKENCWSAAAAGVSAAENLEGGGGGAVSRTGSTNHRNKMATTNKPSSP